jgi:hypothetical protein
MDEAPLSGHHYEAMSPLTVPVARGHEHQEAYDRQDDADCQNAAAVVVVRHVAFSPDRPFGGRCAISEISLIARRAQRL